MTISRRVSSRGVSSRVSLVAATLVAATALGGDAPLVRAPARPRAGEQWAPAHHEEPPRAPAPLDGYLDLRGIFHAHSKWSHDSKGEPETIVAIANELELDFFFMTDHPSPRSLTDGLRGRHGRTLFFAGAETHNLLALDLARPVEGATGADAIAHVRSQDGVALVAHPEEWTEWDAPFQGMEVYNLHYDALKDGPLGAALERAKGKRSLTALADVLATLEKDPGAKRVLDALSEVTDDPEAPLLAFLDRPSLYLERWDRLGKTRRVPGVAGNDSHENIKIGGATLDPYARTLRLVDTHLLARGREAADVREALLAGRAYVAFEAFGDSFGFAFHAEDSKTGRVIAAMGEELVLTGETDLVAQAPPGGTIRILRDGVVVAEEQGQELVARVAHPGVYRVEVSVTRRGRALPWIIGNPIYLRAPD